jgi:hypothetical protein
MVVASDLHSEKEEQQPDHHGSDSLQSRQLMSPQKCPTGYSAQRYSDNYKYHDYSFDNQMKKFCWESIIFEKKIYTFVDDDCKEFFGNSDMNRTKTFTFDIHVLALKYRHFIINA